MLVHIGYWRSSLTLCLADVYWNSDPEFSVYTARGCRVLPRQAVRTYDIGPVKGLGCYATEADARKGLSEAQRIESRIFRAHGSYRNVYLCHKPGTEVIRKGE